MTPTQVGDSTDSRGKLANIFVRIAGLPARSFVIVVNVGPNPVEDEQFEFSVLFKS